MTWPEFSSIYLDKERKGEKRILLSLRVKHDHFPMIISDFLPTRQTPRYDYGQFREVDDYVVVGTQSCTEMYARRGGRALRQGAVKGLRERKDIVAPSMRPCMLARLFFNTIKLKQLARKVSKKKKKGSPAYYIAFAYPLSTKTQDGNSRLSRADRQLDSSFLTNGSLPHGIFGGEEGDFRSLKCSRSF